MPKYAPGSFTKNFGWNTNPPGLSRLHHVIHAGFGGAANPVKRDTFRADCGIADPNRQLIPVNFFLHNTVKHDVNYVSVDELVRHAINNPHSRRFDRLALFAVNLARMGRRVGISGSQAGAAFANDFVRNHLWDAGAWQTSNLADARVERAFDATIEVTGSDTAHKCMTNYLYIFEISGLRYQSTATINTNADEWVGPGLFLAFDRFGSDQATAPTRNELISMVRADELHKLMGVTDAYLSPMAELFADEYLALGGLNRISTPAVTATSGATVASSPARAPRDPAKSSTPRGPSTQAPGPDWSDEDAEDAATVMRRLQEVQSQIRNLRHVRELKALYEHTCAFCGKRMIVGVDPTRHYAEAAHIKPVGLPHNGPDRRDNMLILCSEHHLQFDRGVLRIRQTEAGPVVVSKIKGDPLDGNRLKLRPPHTIDDANIEWHYKFWK
jgi:hypothetical protein